MPNYETVKKKKIQITYKKRKSTIRLVKHVQRGNFPMILYKILKNLLRRGHGIDLVQRTCCMGTHILFLET